MTRARVNRLHYWGKVPCADCKKIHGFRDDPERPDFRTWRAVEDGHPYREMSAREVMAHYGLTAERDGRQ